MTRKDQEFLPTRHSLLERLKSLDDQDSWREFFESYWGLLYRTAVRAGLNDAEAQDVVQDTIISVSKKMPGFRHDPEKDSFKGWLLYSTRNRIAMAYRKRRRSRAVPWSESSGDLEQIADPGGGALETIWDEEWARALCEEALSRAKTLVGAKQFQMFDLYVVKNRPAVEAARALGVPVAQVYLAKHRVSAVLKKEIEALKARLE